VLLGSFRVVLGRIIALYVLLAGIRLDLVFLIVLFVLLGSFRVVLDRIIVLSVLLEGIRLDLRL